MERAVSVFRLWMGVLVCGSLIGAADVQGQSNENNLETSAETIESISTEVSTEPRKWSGSVSLTGEGDFKNLEQGSNFATELVGTYRWVESFSTSLIVTWQQDVTPMNQQEFKDLLLLHSYQLPLKNLALDGAVSVRSAIPASEASRDAGLITTTRLRADIGKTWFQNLTLKPYGSVSWNHSRYNYALNDTPTQSPNVLYTLATGASLTFTYGIVTLGTDWAFSRQQTYIDSVRYRYINETYLSLMASDNISFTIGLRNDDSTSRNGGLDSNIAFFSQDRTKIYGTTSYVF